MFATLLNTNSFTGISFLDQENITLCFFLTWNIFKEMLRLACIRKYVMHCAIWYHLYNFKNVKNTHGGVLLLVKLQVKSLQHYY